MLAADRLLRCRVDDVEQSGRRVGCGGGVPVRVSDVWTRLRQREIPQHARVVDPPRTCRRRRDVGRHRAAGHLRGGGARLRGPPAPPDRVPERRRRPPGRVAGRRPAVVDLGGRRRHQVVVPLDVQHLPEGVRAELVVQEPHPDALGRPAVRLQHLLDRLQGALPPQEARAVQAHDRAERDVPHLQQTVIDRRASNYGVTSNVGWVGSRVVSVLDSGAEGRACVQIAVATLSGNSLRQTVHTHSASVHQAAKLVASLLWAYYNCDTSTIRVRFEHDSATTRYNTLRGFRALAYEIVYENHW